MLRITELSRKTEASVDEIRYLERKGFIKSSRRRLKRREVRQYSDGNIRKVQLIIKYRRQGFTWNVAFDKAVKELENPALF
jgi:DNA-binding transcriptional MerR regulator